MYDSDNYILYLCYLRCRNYYLNALHFVQAIPFCYQVVNYIKAYQPDNVQQLQNEVGRVCRGFRVEHYSRRYTDAVRLHSRCYQRAGRCD